MNWIKDKLKKFWKWITAAFVGGVVIAQVVGFPPVELTNFQLAEQCIATKKINECIGNLDFKQKAKIKSSEIAKLNHVGEYTKGDVRVEIQSLKAIEINGQSGVEVLARAWKGTKQLGFGDGSVEIERFRIFNPPVLVLDPNGTIIRNSRDKIDEGVFIDIINKYREDPIEAVKRDLAHTISLVGKEGNVVKGKIGNTTSTFYPDASPESTSVDGHVYIDTASDLTWAQLRDDDVTYSTADDTTAGSANNFIQFRYNVLDAAWKALYRAVVLFDTSAIPDTDTIDSGTVSFFGQTETVSRDFNDDISLVRSEPNSNTALVAEDYGPIGTDGVFTVKMSDTSIPTESWSQSDYNNFPLNAAGLAEIDVAGISKYAGVMESDRANTQPVLDGRSFASGYFAEQGGAGTTNDPKLVVVHSGAVVPKVKKQSEIFY